MFAKNNPFFDNFTFDKLFEDFDRFFGSCCHVDTDGAGVYQLEVPGFNKDNLTVELSDGLLTIKGNRKVKENYAGNSKIYKRLTVADAEDVKAEVKDGILTLTVKYLERETPGRKIKVE